MDCTEDILRTWWHQEGKLKMKPPVSEFPQPESTARHEEAFPAPFSGALVPASCGQGPGEVILLPLSSGSFSALCSLWAQGHETLHPTHQE